LNTVPDWWDGAKTGHVRIGTVHAFKGLEAEVVIYLAPAYGHLLGPRLAYTAYSRARLRLIVLEGAIPKPAREEIAVAPPTARTPVVPQVRAFNEDQRSLLKGALSAARTWKPGVSG
jgi:hypothetical protein